MLQPINQEEIVVLTWVVTTYTYLLYSNPEKQIILVTVAKQNCWLLISNVTPGNLGNFRLLAYWDILSLSVSYWEMFAYTNA